MIQPQDYVFQEAPGLEQRLAELQAQIDRLTISLQLWRDGQERITPADARLAHFADDAAEILHEWSALGDRHARAVDALEQQVAAFGLAESRLQQQAAERFRTLERMVQQEFATLRQLQLEPPAEQRSQVAALTEACVAAASTPRVLTSTPETNRVGERELLAQLSAVMAMPRPSRAAAHLAAGRTAATTTPAVAEPVEPAALAPRAEPTNPADAASDGSDRRRASSWGRLEHVATEPSLAPPTDASTATAPPAPAPAASTSRDVPRSEPRSAPRAESDLAALRSELGGRITSLQLRLDEADANELAHREEQRRVNARLSAIILLLVTALVGGVWWARTLQRQAVATSQRLTAVEQQSALALKDAADALLAARAQLDTATAEARRSAAENAAMGAVLSAPDLLRYNLLAADGSSASAQVLWSRSRGLVFTAARLGGLYPESAYQLWLLTVDGAVSAGTIVPDESGRASLVLADPPRLPRNLVGVSLTVEQSAGATQPSDRLVASSRVARQAP